MNNQISTYNVRDKIKNINNKIPSLIKFIDDHPELSEPQIIMMEEFMDIPSGIIRLLFNKDDIEKNLKLINIVLNVSKNVEGNNMEEYEKNRDDVAINIRKHFSK